MAECASEDNGAGRLSEGISSGLQCQPGDSFAEWRSSEQVENGTPSTSPPYWDSDDEDDYEPKPSELFGRFTWKIEKFSQISKRELQSNAFEVGGYKWFILIYPQGCDVCNHLSLFLCVASHEKLLPGWSHFAQFTIAVVNKDPEKSKYSDTLHRFWKKEHDWGWKKFMELSKIKDGFIVSDTLVIKAQVQVIREKANGLFRCLDCQYRRELVRVYLSNVELICRRCVEDKRDKICKLIQDKVRWSSFRAFWLGIDHNARHRMSRNKKDVILKQAIKDFFLEKEVTSTLVMDSLYSGLKALEYQSKNEGGRANLVEQEQIPAPIVHAEKDMFVLADDVLVLLKRAAKEPLPPKDDKGPQNRTKDGNCGEDSNKDSIEHDERRLTELGRRTVEIFVLTYIFSNVIEVAYQEAVAFKRQEELIREEAAWLAGSDQKAKHGVPEKKRSKKKQAKQKRNGLKDRGKDEKSERQKPEKHQESLCSNRSLDDLNMQQGPVLKKPDEVEDVSDISDVTNTLQPHVEEERDVMHAHFSMDASGTLPSAEASSSDISCLTVQNCVTEKKSPSVVDDSSSTCSTDSLPSVVTNGPYKLNSPPNCKTQKSTCRGEKHRNNVRCDQTGWAKEMDNQPLDIATDKSPSHDATLDYSKADEPESEDVVLSLKNQIRRLEQHLVKKEEVVSRQKKLSFKGQADVKGPPKQKPAEKGSSIGSPSRSPPSILRSKQVTEATTPVESVPLIDSSNCTPQSDKTVPLTSRSAPVQSAPKLDVQNHTTLVKAINPSSEKPTVQAFVASRSMSAPLMSSPMLDARVTSVPHTSSPLLSQTLSAASGLGTDQSMGAHNYVPQSYRNTILGRSVCASPSTSLHTSSSTCLSTLYSVQSHSPERKEESSTRSGLSFGTVVADMRPSQPKLMRDCIQQENVIHFDPSSLNGMQRGDIFSSDNRSRSNYVDEAPATFSGRPVQGSSVDDFPHLDIINSLLDDECTVGKVGTLDPVFQIPNGNRRSNQQVLFPGHVSMTDVGPSVDYDRYDPAMKYMDDKAQRFNSTRLYNGLSNGAPYVDISGYVNQIDGVFQNHFPVNAADLTSFGMNGWDNGYSCQPPNYSNLTCGINGYTLFLPASEHELAQAMWWSFLAN